MATLGDHLVDAIAKLEDVTVAIVAARAAIENATVAIIALNEKIPQPIDGRLPAFAAVDAAGSVGALSMTSTQLPPTLQSGKLRTTGLL